MNNTLIALIYFTMIVLIIFILLLVTPDIVLSGAKNGLSLWINALIPALFPYMLFSSIMIKTGLYKDMQKLALPLTKLLKISTNASFGIIAGLFFGYPACAANLSLMVTDKKIDKETASFITCAFNNISPAYIIGYTCIGLLNNSTITLPVLVLFYISLLLSTILIRHLLFSSLKLIFIDVTTTIDISSTNITKALKTSLINIGILGCYIIIFSIITEYLSVIPSDITRFLAPFIEIAGGSKFLCSSGYSNDLILLIIMPALSFGGISGILQTIAVDSENFIDIKKYIYSKIISSVTCFAITYIAVYVLKIPI